MKLVSVPTFLKMKNLKHVGHNLGKWLLQIALISRQICPNSFVKLIRSKLQMLHMYLIGITIQIQYYIFKHYINEDEFLKISFIIIFIIHIIYIKNDDLALSALDASEYLRKP